MSGVERKTCMTREDATISAASDFRNAPAHRGSAQGMLDYRGNHGGSETMRRAGRPGLQSRRADPRGGIGAVSASKKNEVRWKPTGPRFSIGFDGSS